jgi:hypothetical protein
MAKKDRPTLKTALPGSLKIPPEELEIRIDIFSDSIMMQRFARGSGAYRRISANDLAHAITRDLSYSSGLLPQNTLWWSNGRDGTVTALWVPPGVRRLALQPPSMEAPERFTIPLPGLVFLCTPGQPPRVYAARKRPVKLDEMLYRAPLANVYKDGSTCPGNHKYPVRVTDIPDDFFRSFFSAGADLRNRSKAHPDNIIEMWRELNKLNVQEYAIDDLVEHGTVKEVMRDK